MNRVDALTPEAVKELLLFLYRTDARRSALLLGPPGIGKSALVREAAEEIADMLGRRLVEYKRQHLDGIEPADVYARPDRYFMFVDLRLTETEPVDLLGRPVTVTVAGRKQLVYHPPQWVVFLSEVPGILFLDELTNVQRPDVLAAAYKLIQDRAAGFTAFGPQVQVVAAGNRPEESSIANLLPAPLLNRVYRFGVRPPTVREWLRWMGVHYPRCDEKVFAYVSRFPDDFCRVPEEGETLEGFPTPRSYTFLARDLAAAAEAGLDSAALRILCIAALGPEVGEKLFAFRQSSVPTYEELLREPALFERLDIDGRYIAMVIIGQGLAEASGEIARGCQAQVEIPLARAAVRPAVAAAVGLLEAVAVQSREYLTLLWFTLANRLAAPWHAAVYLEMCDQSYKVREAYAAVGDLLK